MSLKEKLLWAVGLVLVYALTACSGGTVALVVDGDGHMNEVTCVELDQPGAKAQWICC